MSVAEDDGATSFEVDFGALVDSFRDAYQYMPMSVERYLLLILVPSSAFGVFLIIAVALLQPPLMVSMPMALLAVFMPFVALVYPKVVQDRHRKEIRERFHLFITHLTVLSTTNINRVEVFRTLAHEKEYAALAEEMGYIVGLIDTWNQSLEDACRMRAKHVPSPLMRDFLERLAYIVGAGQEMSDFLLTEQDSIIQHFAVRYEADLDKLSLFKDLYLSMILSSTFALVFAIVIPFILGIDPRMALIGVIFLYVFVQAVFLYLMNNIAPYDPVWYLSKEQSLSRNVRIRISLMVAIGLSLFLIAATYAVLSGFTPVAPDAIPLPFYLAIPFTPLLLPGFVTRREEKSVKNRDSEFPSFIRALGAVESVKQSSTSNVLKSLQKKDFGSLSENITHLYRRLNIRIDSTRSWRLFAGETGSYLIQKFSDMYVIGRRMGGEPRRLGELISKNMTEVLKLRERRQQETGTVIGVVYGVTATSAFAFFMGLEIIRMLTDITAQMNVNASLIGSLLHAEVYDLPEIQFMLFAVVLLNSLLSSLMIRVVDRGHTLTGLLHFVTLTWISAATAVATQKLIQSFISIG
ncbi:archaellar assembly protein FlaJ [Halobacteriaceae archaeon GCM10025711]